MNLENAEPAFAWSARAFELIDEDADRETFVYQLNNRGTMMLLLGRPEGRDELEHSIALAKKAGLEDHVGRGYIHVGWVASRLRDFALMERLSEGIEYCTEHGLELWRLYLIAYRARAQLDQGDWTEAAESALFVLNQPQQAPLLRLLTLTVLGTIRARRGDPDASSPLEEALELSAGKADLQHLAPVAIARTEAAALEGNLQVAEEASSAVLEIAVERGAVWVAGELAYWRRRGGIVESMPDGIPEPFARALSEHVPDRLSKLEYVSAMAELQQRTRAFDLAIENVYTDFRRRVARFLGIDNYRTTRNEIAKSIAERAKLDLLDVEDTLFKCEDIIHGEPTSKAEVLRLTVKLREFEGKLGMTRTTKVKK